MNDADAAKQTAKMNGRVLTPRASAMLIATGVRTMAAALLVTVSVSNEVAR